MSHEYMCTSYRPLKGKSEGVRRNHRRSNHGYYLIQPKNTKRSHICVFWWKLGLMIYASANADHYRSVGWDRSRLHLTAVWIRASMLLLSF